MQQRHLDRQRYFNEQSETTLKHVIPYIDTVMPVNAGLRVLEVGCGEGGNLKPFVDMGCESVGIDINKTQIETAKALFESHPNVKNLTLIGEDIYKVDPVSVGQFDLIFLRDVIEHIPHQEEFMAFIKAFMKPHGIIFFGFPPWTMPFGGHQQILRSKIGSKLPYYHILPYWIYNGMLKMFGEGAAIKTLNEIKDTGISTYRFHRILKSLDYKIKKETYFLINPNYETKFKLKQRKLWSIFKIPYISDFYTTALYCIISK